MHMRMCTKRVRVQAKIQISCYTLPGTVWWYALSARVWLRLSTMGEPGQTKPYHEDLRWRIVWQRILSNLSIREISANLNVAVSTV